MPICYLRINTKGIDLERNKGREDLREIEMENHNENILDETICFFKKKRKKIKFISYLFDLKDHINRPIFMK